MPRAGGAPRLEGHLCEAGDLAESKGSRRPPSLQRPSSATQCAPYARPVRASHPPYLTRGRNEGGRAAWGRAPPPRRASVIHADSGPRARRGRAVVGLLKTGFNSGLASKSDAAADGAECVRLRNYRAPAGSLRAGSTGPDLRCRCQTRFRRGPRLRDLSTKCARQFSDLRLSGYPFG